MMYMEGKRSDFLTVAGMVVLFLMVIGMNVHLIFGMTSNQSEEIGQMQLERIRSDLQDTLLRAEGTTQRLAGEVETMLAAGA